MTMNNLSCWICEEFDECPFPVCYEQQSKQLSKEWDEEKALTQDEIKEIQLEFKL